MLPLWKSPLLHPVFPHIYIISRTGEGLGMGQKIISQCLESSGSNVILSAQRLYGFCDQELKTLILQVRIREDEWLTQDNLSDWLPTPRWESWFSSQHPSYLAELFYHPQTLGSHNNRHLKHHNLKLLVLILLCYSTHSIWPKKDLSQINERTPDKKATTT